MPRTKRRMGAFNALNDLPSVEDLPLTETPTETAPLWPWLESRTPAPPHPVAMHRMPHRPRRIGGFNALDDLLPGPVSGEPLDAPDDEAPGLAAEQAAGTAVVDRRAALPPAEPSGFGFNALDDLLPGPGGFTAGGLGQGGGRQAPSRQPAPRAERVRMTFLLPADVVEAAEDAVSFLAGPPTRLTMRTLAEQALRNEVDRLADVYYGGNPFPHRTQRA